ncbi:hypothetical protein RJ639_041477, partial [Escallonia herrerae]
VTKAMAEESKKDHDDVEEKLVPATNTVTEEKKKKKIGVISRIWNKLFRLRGDDFEKRLQYISKEEASVLARMKKRSLIAVGYAIMTTRSLDLDWKMRALRVLPMFLLPALSFLTYSALLSFTRMCDRKDQKTLERLRAERQEKIEELKEKTNYYTTQQLIQRYDPDPAVQAAAATVLAARLGADSGLKLYMGDESKVNPPAGKSNDVEYVQSRGLRNRKQSHTRSSSADATVLHLSDEEMLQHADSEGPEISEHNQLAVEHHHQTGANTLDGGWIARIAALLVGEDPTQSYALICGNCHMHNGLARKEDFPYITYYCPHCNALNRPKQTEEHASDSISLIKSSSKAVDDINISENNSRSMSEAVPASSSPVEAGAEKQEESEKTSAADLAR